MSIAGVNGMDMFNKQNHTHRGMVLVISLLVTAIVLSIGMNLANIAAKQLVLSSFNKESHKAIFMADAALECVLYWDTSPHTNTAMLPGRDDGPSGNGNNRRYFFRNPLDSSGASNETVTCFNNATAGWNGVIERNDPDGSGPNTGRNSNTGVIQFELKQGNDNSLPCAKVILTKTLLSPTSVSTRLETFGYNTCDPTNPRRVERGLEMTY